jgi:hypothetical protein
VEHTSLNIQMGEAISPRLFALGGEVSPLIFWSRENSLCILGWEMYLSVTDLCGETVYPILPQ